MKLCKYCPISKKSENRGIMAFIYSFNNIFTMTFKQYHVMIGILFISLVISQTTTALCDIYVYSSLDSPVQNTEIILKNLTDGSTLATNLTNLSGMFTYTGSCENISVSATYPSSNYSALLRNASVLSQAHINGWITARVQLVNTLGSFLEGQDCSVVVYGANTSTLIHDYNTLCQTGEPYLDKNNNWATVTNCKFTDSRGWYTFKGKIDESMNYEYDNHYDLIFTCNGKQETVTFTTKLERQPDMNKLEDFTRDYGGVLFLLFLLLIIVIVFILLFVILINKKQDKKPKS